jgi:putative spermidine/putrescine transport system permease protein
MGGQVSKDLRAGSVLASAGGVGEQGAASAGRMHARVERDAHRSRRFSHHLVTAAMVGPLIVFLLVCYLVPLASLLTRAAWDPTVSDGLPATARALSDWDRRSIPDDKAFVALRRDLLAADDKGLVGRIGTRLDSESAGFKGLLLRTIARIDPQDGDNDDRVSKETQADADAKAQMLKADPRWGQLKYWLIIGHNINPLTPNYLLRAVDVRQTPAGQFERTDNDEASFLSILGRTIYISGVVTTIVCLIGYPFAYWLTGLSERRRGWAMIALLVPFWTSTLVRIAAWMVVLPREGPVNKFLTAIHATSSPIDLLYNRIGVYVSMVHILLPFVILPLFSVMRGIPKTYQKAAISLGSHPFAAFWRVYFPQTITGLAAGAILVFITALGYYIAPALLGGAGDQLLSYYIAYYTNTTINWGLASALSLLLLIATALLFVVYRNFARIETFASR